MNTKIQDILLKSVDSEHIQLLSDTELIELHKTCKFENNTLSGFAKSNSMKYLPLVESEIVKRQDELRKSKENDLEKGNHGQVGEIREWGTKKYKKQDNGKWLEISESHGMTKKEHEEKSKEHEKSYNEAHSTEWEKHDLRQMNKHRAESSNLSDKEYDESELDSRAENREKHNNFVAKKKDKSRTDTQKSEETDLEKGGEGSRGDKVIGHTKSGKPIYENSQHTSADFTHEDHSDAMSAHMKAAKEHQHKSDFNKHANEDLQSTQSEDKNRRDDEIKETWDSQHRHQKQAQHHSSMAQLHQNAMNQKLDEGTSKGEEIDLEKGGEGSRGGKVIGHTSSGKPVYEVHSKAVHSDFNALDHHEAAQIHIDKIKELAKNSGIKHEGFRTPTISHWQEHGHVISGPDWEKSASDTYKQVNLHESQNLKHTSLAQARSNQAKKDGETDIHRGSLTMYSNSELHTPKKTDIAKSESHKHQDLIKSNIANSFKTEIQQFDTSNLSIEKEIPENKPYESEPLNTIQVGIERQKSFADNLKKTYE